MTSSETAYLYIDLGPPEGGFDSHAVGLSAGEVVDVDSDPGRWANLLAIAALVLTRNG